MTSIISVWLAKATEEHPAFESLHRPAYGIDCHKSTQLVSTTNSAVENLCSSFLKWYNRCLALDPGIGNILLLDSVLPDADRIPELLIRSTRLVTSTLKKSSFNCR